MTPHKLDFAALKCWQLAYRSKKASLLEDLSSKARRTAMADPQSKVAIEVEAGAIQYADRASASIARLRTRYLMPKSHRL